MSSYMRNPSDFIVGTIMLSAEEKGIYSTLTDMMYDCGEPLAPSYPALARVCGATTRRFNIVRNKLLRLGKLILLDDGRLTSAAFEAGRPKKTRLKRGAGR